MVRFDLGLRLHPADFRALLAHTGFMLRVHDTFGLSPALSTLQRVLILSVDDRLIVISRPLLWNIRRSLFRLDFLNGGRHG